MFRFSPSWPAILVLLLTSHVLLSTHHALLPKALSYVPPPFSNLSSQVSFIPVHRPVLLDVTLNLLQTDTVLLSLVPLVIGQGVWGPKAVSNHVLWNSPPFESRWAPWGKLFKTFKQRISLQSVGGATTHLWAVISIKWDNDCGKWLAYDTESQNLPLHSVALAAGGFRSTVYYSGIENVGSTTFRNNPASDPILLLKVH